MKFRQRRTSVVGFHRVNEVFKNMVLKKKKILIITFPQGGPFVWAKNLAQELEKRGYDVTLASGRKEYLKQQFKYYDIVHTCVPLPNLLCKKYILTIHGNFKEEKMIGRIMTPLASWRANAVTVPSQFLKNTLGLKKARVISNGINISETAKNNYALNSENPKLGILTNFNFRKKAEGILRLAEIVKNTSPQSNLLIGGAGIFLEEYKPKILAIFQNVKFLGHCKKEDLFNEIDIFAYYSLLDNQPLAILEAMAFGLPVVSNNVGAVKEIMTGSLGSYIAKTDEEYENMLKTLLDSEKAREENGREAKKNSQDFSWEKIVEKLIEIYE